MQIAHDLNQALAWHMVLYWSVGLWLSRTSHWKWTSVKAVLVNQVVATGLCLQVLSPWINRDPEGPAITWKQLGIQMFTVYMVTCVTFHALHYAFHTRWLWRFHRYHHRWVKPIPLYAFDAHPLEHVLVNLLPVMLGPLLLQWPMLWIQRWLSLATISSLWAHTSNMTGFHQLHHRYLTCNFGTTCWTDMLMGTWKRDVSHLT